MEAKNGVTCSQARRASSHQKPEEAKNGISPEPLAEEALPAP